MILREIKKGELGTGFLLEKDSGYIDINSEGNKPLKEALENKDGEWHIPHPFIVQAVFQKADTPNANGRVYPRSILEREVTKYLEKCVDRRGYGECYTPDSLILTEKGWKTLEDVEEGENVLTLNTENNQIEINPIIKKIFYKYDGDMIRIKSRTINDLVTPNHKFVLYGRNYKYKGRYSAQEMMDDLVSDMNHSYIPKKGTWIYESEETFTIKGLEKEEIQAIWPLELKEKYSQDLIFPIKPFMAFMGIYLSEGWARTRSKKQRGFVVGIAQKKENVILEIRELLEILGVEFKEKTNNGKIVAFTITDARLHKYLFKFGKAQVKYIPFEIKNQSKELLTIFYDWFVKGDGRKRGSSDDVFSTSKQLALDLNEIQLKIGYSGNFHSENRRYDRYIKDDNGVNRLIEGKNCHDMHFTYKSIGEGIWLSKEHLSVEKYSGNVACVEVKNHNFYVMCNGFSHWTSNCDHPEQTTISTKNLAINIIKLWWEGKTVVGNLEVILSPGYIKYGIVSTPGDALANNIYFNKLKLGVSSRGVGSVKNVHGQNYVDTDFELICWDVVTDPSTPNAWIANKQEDLSSFIEQDQNKNKKNKLIEKIDKALSIV
jgi:hypothetical protein